MLCFAAVPCRRTLHPLSLRDARLLQVRCREAVVCGLLPLHYTWQRTSRQEVPTLVSPPVLSSAAQPSPVPVVAEREARAAKGSQCYRGQLVLHRKCKSCITGQPYSTAFRSTANGRRFQSASRVDRPVSNSRVYLQYCSFSQHAPWQALHATCLVRLPLPMRAPAAPRSPAAKTHYASPAPRMHPNARRAPPRSTCPPLAAVTGPWLWSWMARGAAAHAQRAAMAAMIPARSAPATVPSATSWLARSVCGELGAGAAC